MASVTMRDACHGRHGAQLGRGGGDGGKAHGDNHTGGGPHPQHVLDREHSVVIDDGYDGCYLDCQEGCDSETRCLVLSDDLITVGQHLGHGGGGGHLTQRDQALGVEQADHSRALLSHPHTQPSLHYPNDGLGLLQPHPHTVLNVAGVGVEYLDGVAGAAPDVATNDNHLPDRSSTSAHRQTFKPSLVPDTV